ncbi:MAG: Hsp20/alpha crystallin family protein [Rikenellaceae bacterium]|nr:Hsp20/alpha crystallin family protein [Rikenellaceae bacterium]
MDNKLKKTEKNTGLVPSFFNRYFNDDFFKNMFDGDMPATNVTENDNEFKLDLSVPGYSKEDFKVTIDKNILTVSAQKEVKNEEKGDNEKIIRQEFRSSSFRRSFTLPEDIDTDSIKAEQHDGILEISLPKSEKAKEDNVRKIEIK